MGHGRERCSLPMDRDARLRRAPHHEVDGWTLHYPVARVSVLSRHIHRPHPEERPKGPRLEGWATGESGARCPWIETRGFAALLTMRSMGGRFTIRSRASVSYLATSTDLILRSGPKGRVSKDGPRGKRCQWPMVRDARCARSSP